MKIFVLGATGRSGAPFVAQALARGHEVAALVRSAARLPEPVRSHPRFRAVVGELHDDAVATDAMRASRPDVVFSALSSERAPNIAVSTGTRTVVHALREIGARAVPFVSVASWGLGPSRRHVTHPLARALVAVAKATFWSKPFADFERQFAALDEAKREGLLRPILLLPPILTEGPKTSTYRSGEPDAMKDFTGVMASVSRASLADLALRLCEQAAGGGDAPEWVAIREP